MLRAPIEQHRLGAIVMHGPEGLVANHIPFEFASACEGAPHDAPRDFLDRLAAEIVGIEIPVMRIQGTWKMSQNRSANDQRSVAADTGLPMQVRS